MKSDERVRERSSGARRLLDEIHYLTLLQVSDLIRTQIVSSVDVCHHLLARIDNLDGQLKSYVRVLSEDAMSAASQADEEIRSGLWRGPLHGVPLGIKDNLDVAGVPTACGMEIFEDRVAHGDATVVARLRRAGAIVIGKLRMTEGAGLSHHPLLPVPVNPWSSDHWTGVSSSGAGVAVAAGLCYGALGSDTAGSVRHPSTACGVSGIKPTRGLVSRNGLFPLAESFDHVGPLARTVSDAAAILQTIAGEDPLDPTTLAEPVPNWLLDSEAGASGVEVGVDWSLAETDVDSTTAENFKNTVYVMRQMGARIREVKLPSLAPALAVMLPQLAVEARIAHEATFPRLADRYGTELRQRIELGATVRAEDLAKAALARAAFVGTLRKFFTENRMLVTPASPAPTLTWKELKAISSDIKRVADRIGRYTMAFNAPGNPVVALPSGFAPNGTPLGIQLVGADLTEGNLVRVGDAFQRATNFTACHPRL